MSPEPPHFETARHILAEAMHAIPASLAEDADVTNTPGWDSIAHVNVMMAVEALTGGPVPAADAGRLFSLQAIAHYIARRTGLPGEAP